MGTQADAVDSTTLHFMHAQSLDTLHNSNVYTWMVSNKMASFFLLQECLNCAPPHRQCFKNFERLRHSVFRFKLCPRCHYDHSQTTNSVASKHKYFNILNLNRWECAEIHIIWTIRRKVYLDKYIFAYKWYLGTKSLLTISWQTEETEIAPDLRKYHPKLWLFIMVLLRVRISSHRHSRQSLVGALKECNPS